MKSIESRLNQKDGAIEAPSLEHMDKPRDLPAPAAKGLYDAPSQEPACWGMRSEDGFIYDVIHPEEHARHEGAYTTPLYTHPSDAAAQIAYWQGRAESWERDAKVLQAENKKLRHELADYRKHGRLMPF